MSPIRRLLTLSSTFLCLLGLGATSCSDDGEKADKSTTTEKVEPKAGDDGKSTTTGDGKTTTTAADTTSTTVSDEEFTTKLQPAVDQLKAAQEPCDVVAAVSQLSEMPDPAGPEQNRQAVEFLVLVVDKAADTTTDPAKAEELRSSGQALSDYAKSVDYAPEKLDFSGEGPDIPEWDALDTAMNDYFETHTQECTGTGTGSTDSTPATP